MAHKKETLPTKTCLGCGKSFAWRKKWERCWDEVRWCSERCRREGGKRQGKDAPSRGGSGA
jgi:hypothetical protein